MNDNNQRVYNELKRMVKNKEITDQEYGLALKLKHGSDTWKMAVANIIGMGKKTSKKTKKKKKPLPHKKVYPVVERKKSPSTISEKISETEAIVILRPKTRNAEYYYYFHIGGFRE